MRNLHPNQQIQLPFLESRNYLHATTLLETANQSFGATRKIKFKINQLIESQSVRFVEIEPGRSPAEFAALITWDAGGQEKSLGVEVLSNSGDELQPEHFDQASIAGLATLKERKINFSGTSNYSFFKILSALNSALLKSAVTVEKPGQWYFVKIDLDAVPENPDKLELELVTIGPNQEITKSVIRNAGQSIGNIYFAWN